jgi:hypothetical protein
VQLTPQQQSTIHAAILADNALNTLTASSNSIDTIVNSFNATASPDFYVYKTNVAMDDVFNAVLWANFTPASPSLGAGTDATNWLLACQGKQFNLQTMLTGRSTINAAKPNLRTGLQDALTNIPSGVEGANRSGGWPAVQLILSRPANVVEKLFATGTGSQASPATMSLEGSLDYSDVLTIMGWG